MMRESALEDPLVEFLRAAEKLSKAITDYRYLAGSVRDIEQAWFELAALWPRVDRDVIGTLPHPRFQTRPDDSEPG